MSELEKFDFSDIFPREQSQFVRFDDIKDMINQPKLSIPKKIAELLDTSNGDWGNVEIEELDYWIFPNIPDGKESYRSALASAYLAGKALGVDLVEVEG